ncbi:RcnB family protein [Phenylobacterium sp. J367]|uniref:RcnB family protein n=1 Tax=Phenylobacterium sp. J367 TaxID=2898435 RepID=UPI0021515C05|nr:RcnB family protein [Phenylobacterium sp. J367]MCR5878967.1 RcnB family protein [Phenylobacterium sp. J367]
MATAAPTATGAGVPTATAAAGTVAIATGATVIVATVSAAMATGAGRAAATAGARRPTSPAGTASAIRRSTTAATAIGGHVWRAPVGFYVRAWTFGEILPRGWYDAPYRLGSWWDFGLPMPPPGYDWVRVGYDAVLVDLWSGRVVQVVRYVFW